MKIFLSLACLFMCLNIQAEKLKVCTTVTDLAALTTAVGGDFVEIANFTPAQGNPHNVIAKPSFIKKLSQADLFIQVGFDLEAGWAPVLIKSCRNANVQPGEKGHLDPSNVIRPLFEKTGPVTRADGHVHASGNPHYLMDPVNGLIVAHLINSRLKVLKPEQTSYFNDRLAAFQEKLIVKLIGPKLAEKYDSKKMSTLIRRGKLNQFLTLTKQEKELGGWLHEVKQYEGRRFLADHANYLYLIKRFDMTVVDYLEPKPGMAPTTSHLMGLIKNLKGDDIKGILTAAYFPAKYAQLISKKSAWPIIKLAHQVGVFPEADNYLSMVDYNIKAIAKSLR